MAKIGYSIQGPVAKVKDTVAMANLASMQGTPDNDIIIPFVSKDQSSNNTSQCYNAQYDTNDPTSGSRN